MLIYLLLIPQYTHRESLTPGFRTQELMQRSNTSQVSRPSLLQRNCPKFRVHLCKKWILASTRWGIELVLNVDPVCIAPPPHMMMMSPKLLAVGRGGGGCEDSTIPSSRKPHAPLHIRHPPGTHHLPQLQPHNTLQRAENHPAGYLYQTIHPLPLSLPIVFPHNHIDNPFRPRSRQPRLVLDLHDRQHHEQDHPGLFDSPPRRPLRTTSI
ncbi:hypothetical protein EX30DRAFT_210915 [Ascodesmis nigricans]|uniref:Uncharacterized protein n=1 Tax=Ascodesmis nigricans TaxID=341454 RepID=A0A4V3SHQ0_9PEZI|nr:hypothetical protein EX30DRAFT_210915 [Ascodesmis nigricans]